MKAHTQSGSAEVPGILEIPSELLIYTLSHLHTLDILRFSRTCKSAWNLIQRTTSLRLQIELYAAGQRLLGGSSRSAADSLELLEKYQRAWSNVSFRQTTAVKYPHISSFVYELSGGKLVFGEASQTPRNATGALHIYDLTTNSDPPPREVVRLARDAADFAMDVSQNLLVLIEREHTGITLHLHTFDTNIRHPDAKQPSLKTHIQGYTTVHIVGPILAALFVDPTARSYFLVVWNWVTGEVIGNINGLKLDSMTLLAHDALVVVNLDQETLDVYKIELEPAKLALFQRLVLPRVTTNEDGTPWTYEQALLRAYPPPIWPNSSNRKYHTPETSYPFRTDEEDGVIACFFQSHNSSFSMFVRRSALLVPHFGGSPPVGLVSQGQRIYAHVIPWSRWGPDNTRWIPVHCSMRWICYVHGYRVAILEPDPPLRINGTLGPDEDDPLLLQQQELIRRHVDRVADGANSYDMSYLTHEELFILGINFTTRPRALRLLDFNPRTAARAKGDAAFARGNPLSVVKERVGRGQLLVEVESNFQERVITKLPYLETTVKLHELGAPSVHSNVEGVMINANSLILLRSEREAASKASVQIFQI